MTEEKPGIRRKPGLRTVRMEGFSDGVFAIAITLLVLEIAIPPGSDHNLLKALADQWPSYLVYLISFASIGGIWLKHAALTAASSVLIRLNLLLLMVVAFLPFPTRLVAEHLHERVAERVAVTVYGVNLMLASVLVAVMWRYAVREQLVRPDATDEEVAMVNKRLLPRIAGYERLLPSIAGYIVALIVGLFAPVVAVLGYLALALYIILPAGVIRHRRSDT
jgi:uncharacterized membrane protein